MRLGRIETMVCRKPWSKHRFTTFIGVLTGNRFVILFNGRILIVVHKAK